MTSRHLRWIATGAAIVAALQFTQPSPQASRAASAGQTSAQTPPPQSTTQPPPATAGQGQRPQPSFRAGVDLVSLNVTVTDGTARYITDLTAQDFNVFEDGVKQEVTFFNRTNLPIALALLLDTSASMET